MCQTRPLPDTHPELSVYHWPGFTEYRVEHLRLARDCTGRILRGTCVWSWVDVFVVVVASLLVSASVCRESVESPGCMAHFVLPIQGNLSPRALVVGVPLVLSYLLWTRCTQVLYESLLIFPTLGIQLETHRGYPLLPPLWTTYHFIPLSALEDVVLHEGFRRWDVRYYLVALYRQKEASGVGAEGLDAAPDVHALGRSSGVVKVRVAFENILPYFPVLKEVYLGVQQTFFPPPTRIVETEGQTDS